MEKNENRLENGQTEDMANKTVFKQLSERFDDIYIRPETYLDHSKTAHDEFLSYSKQIYDLMKECEPVHFAKHGSYLKELLIKDFDNEQIWQEIQLSNKSLKSHKNSVAIKNKFNLTESSSNIDKPDNESEIEEEQEEEDDENSDNSSDENVDNESIEFSDQEELSQRENKNKKYKKTVVDDQFFKLREMEEFLDEQDKKEMMEDGGEAVDDENDIDFFNDDLGTDEEDSDDENQIGDARELKYADFFGGPKTKRKKKNSELESGFGTVVDEEGEEDSEEEQSENLEDDEEKETDQQAKSQSAFEKKQDEMMQKIQRLEESNISDKPWQLKGETTAKQRPVNSLLEEHVSFDHTSVGAPVVTEETTETLEDMIRQRIKDQAWDDVERKQKPSTQAFEYKKAPELNMEKSKLSLAEVYEKEYLKQAETRCGVLQEKGTSQNVGVKNQTEKADETNEEHVVIQDLMDSLFVKLDALSNFYFTPKPPRPELKIVTNTPSINMEEVTPITMTTASQLAPEEIHDKKKGDIKGDGEKEDEDRKRERRQKKIKKKFASKERERKENLKVKEGRVTKSSKKSAIDVLKKGTRNTIVSEKNSTDKSVKSSNAFFTKLQDEAKKSISDQKVKKMKGSSKKKTEAKSLKL